MGALTSKASSSTSPVCPPIVLQRKAAIVIVGGGPAGIHFASLLAKRGFSDIKVIETRQLGGKSSTHVDSDGVPHEMGTCYLHALYDPIRALIAEYDSSNVEHGLTHEMAFGTDVRGKSDSDVLHGKEFTKVVLEKAEEASSIPQSCWSFWPDQMQYVTIASAIERYIKLHRDLFGEYEYGLPPRPSNWMLVDMTAMQFLERNNLKALVGMLRYSQQLQGYGVLEDIHAFYMLWWVHPNLLKSAITQTFTGAHGVNMLSKGYQSLWDRIAQHHIADRSIDLIADAKVTRVARGNEHARPTVSYVNVHTNESYVLPCDHVVMAVDLSRQATRIISDITDGERHLFSAYSTSVLCTTLYESDEQLHEYSVDLWINRMRPDAGRDGQGVTGRMHAQRNSSVALGRSKPGRQRRVAYQYLGRQLRPTDPTMLAAQLMRDLELAGERNIEVIKQRPWPYMPHFNANGLRQCFPWRILARQGENRTIYIGSSVCFESVLDCVQYNNMIAKSIVVIDDDCNH